MEDLKGYSREQLTIDLVRANVVGLLSIIPITLLFGLPYYLIWKEQFTINKLRDFLEGFSSAVVGSGAVAIFVVMIGGIVVHELIHGITWARYTKKGFRSIKFGILWKMLTPYCHCKEPLRLREYVTGAMAPGIVVGILPAIIAIIIGSVPLLLFGIFFTMAASGDVMIINLLRNEKRDDLVLDHPSEAGCYIYRKTEDETSAGTGEENSLVNSVSRI